MHPVLAPGPHDFVVLKRNYSAFFKTSLDALPHGMNRPQLIMTGNDANHGCMVTAVDAYLRNLTVFFMADALGETGADGHDLALRWVAGTCSQIARTTDVVGPLEKGG